MIKFSLIILFMSCCLSSFSQSGRGTFRNCPKDESFFPDWVFPILEYTTSTNSMNSVSSNCILLTEFLIDIDDDRIKDTLRTFTRALDSSDKEMNNYFSNVLRNFEEPVLCNITGNQEIYRLILLRTFDHPIVIRLEHNDSLCRIFWKVGNGMAGYNQMNKIIKRGSMRIKNSDWVRFTNSFDKVNFWIRLNYRDLPEADGSTLLLEASSATKYNALIYSSALKHSGFMEVCRMLIELTRLKIYNDALY